MRTIAQKKKYHKTYNQKRYHILKRKYVELLGGKCIFCGETHISKLQFDHIDPYEKSFNLGTKITYPEKYVLEELKKCQILCKKCHDEKNKIDGSINKNKAKGERVNTTKLTSNQVLQIREDLKNINTNVLSKKYSVSTSCIRQIRQRRTWKHI